MRTRNRNTRHNQSGHDESQNRQDDIVEILKLKGYRVRKEYTIMRFGIRADIVAFKDGRKIILEYKRDAHDFGNERNTNKEERLLRASEHGYEIYYVTEAGVKTGEMEFPIIKFDEIEAEF